MTGTTLVLLVRQLRHGFTKTAKVSPNLTDAHNYITYFSRTMSHHRRQELLQRQTDNYNVADGVSCITLRAMNPSSLSVKQLGQLNETIFNECGNALGSADGYSHDQLLTLGTQIAKVQLSIIFAVTTTHSTHISLIFHNRLHAQVAHISQQAPRSDRSYFATRSTLRSLIFHNSRHAQNAHISQQATRSDRSYFTTGSTLRSLILHNTLHAQIAYVSGKNKWGVGCHHIELVHTIIYIFYNI